MTTKLLKQVDLGKNANLLLEERMFSGSYYEKVFLFFESRKEFSFPMKQISSIRWVKETSPKTKSVIWGLILVIGGIWLLSTVENAYKIFGVIALLWGLYKLYVNFRPQVGIRVTVSGGDAEFIGIPSSKEKDAKELVFLVNEKIASL